MSQSLLLKLYLIWSFRTSVAIHRDKYFLDSDSHLTLHQHHHHHHHFSFSFFSMSSLLSSYRIIIIITTTTSSSASFNSFSMFVVFVIIIMSDLVLGLNGSLFETKADLVLQVLHDHTQRHLDIPGFWLVSNITSPSSSSSTPPPHPLVFPPSPCRHRHRNSAWSGLAGPTWP